MTVQRKIIHIDMDAFFASVEQRDDPLLRGKPVAVGGSRERGVVAAASYEARQFGVRSAMPSAIAKRKCPALIFVKPDFEKYKAVSRKIHEIFTEYTDLVEPLSLDEAFLDVTEHKTGADSATLIAREIQKRISETLHLTASAGVSYNKFLAKIASDVNKPNGLFIIPPEKAEAFIEQLPIEKFFGIGKVTAGKLNEMGIHFGRDLKKLERYELIRHFGKVGSYYYDICRGIDLRPVNPHRERKSIGAERTFTTDLYLFSEIKEQLEQLVSEVGQRMNQRKATGKTITLKVKFTDFEQITRSHTFPSACASEGQVLDWALKLLPLREIEQRGMRLMGLTFSNLSLPGDREPVQLSFDF